MPKSVVIVDGIATSYVQEGKGQDVVLLHGWGDSKQTFVHLLPVLSKNYRVTALDLPGFGASEPPKEPWDLTNYAKFLKAFCDKTAVSPKIVIGHSNGGAVAILATAQKYIQPDKLVLLAASGVRDPASLRRSGIQLVAKTGKLATFWLPLSTRQRLQRALYGTVGSDMLVAPGLKETFKRTVRQDIQADARLIQTPTLLLYGEHDRATSIKGVGQKLHALIKGSQLVQIPGAGHFVHHDASQEVERQIVGFLS